MAFNWQEIQTKIWLCRRLLQWLRGWQINRGIRLLLSWSPYFLEFAETRCRRHRKHCGRIHCFGRCSAWSIVLSQNPSSTWSLQGFRFHIPGANLYRQWQCCRDFKEWCLQKEYEVAWRQVSLRKARLEGEMGWYSDHDWKSNPADALTKALPKVDFERLREHFVVEKSPNWWKRTFFKLVFDACFYYANQNDFSLIF